jgi:hypothetical protein
MIRNFAATEAAASAWRLLEAGGFPEPVDLRPPCELGLSYPDAVLMYLEAAKAAHLEQIGKIDRSRKIDKATRKLKVLLAAGPRARREVYRLMRGFSARTIKRARKQLGVRAYKVGLDSGWMLEIRSKIEVGQLNRIGPLRKFR